MAFEPRTVVNTGAIAASPAFVDVAVPATVAGKLQGALQSGLTPTAATCSFDQRDGGGTVLSTIAATAGIVNPAPLHPTCTVIRVTNTTATPVVNMPIYFGLQS